MEHPTETVHIGRLIKHQLSLRPEMTIKIFAEKLGVHEQTVYDIYRREDINTEQLKRIAEILDLPITYFFFPDESSETDFANSSNGNGIRTGPPEPESHHGSHATQRAASSESHDRTSAAPTPQPAQIAQPDTPALPRSAPQPSPNGSSSPNGKPAELELLQKQLKWAHEKISLLEARIADKDEMIELLKNRS